MRLSINDQNLIAVENVKKEDVDFVIVDGVFFERNKDIFCNITDDNLNGYEVKIAPTNNIYLELEITAHKDSGEVLVIVEDIQRQHGKILFKPEIASK